MKRLHLASIAFAVALLAPTLGSRPVALAQVQLRPIDRATVRIMSLRQLEPNAATGRRTHARRVRANAISNHGSGVAIAPNLVLTARHVVWGADSWSVLPPRSSTPMAARPVYIDLDRDLAVLFVDGELPHHIAVGEPRDLTLSEPVSASGYPLDLREPIPAATSGEVSRVTRDGELHLTMNVNPGHSGGPVIDRQGQLVGIMSARGRTDRGVEGLAVAVPMNAIVAALALVPSERPTFAQYDRDLASATAWLANVADQNLSEDQEAILPLLQRALQWPAGDADRDAIFSALAWNLLIEQLEDASTSRIEQLPETDRAVATRLRGTAVQLARRALASGPYVRRRYPVLRPILRGEVEAHPPTPVGQ